MAPPTADRALYEAMQTELTDAKAQIQEKIDSLHDWTKAMNSFTHKRCADIVNSPRSSWDEYDGYYDDEFSGLESEENQFIRHQFNLLRDSLDVIVEKCVDSIWSRVSDRFEASQPAGQKRSSDMQLSIMRPLKIARIDASLTTLPDLIMLIIFDNIPLEDLLYNIKRVCKRFAALQPEAIKRRRSMTILIGNKPDLQNLITSSDASYEILNKGSPLKNTRLISGTDADLNKLEYCDFSLEEAFNLYRVMPQVTKLVIVLQDDYSLDGLRLLLISYAANLTSLELFCDPSDKYEFGKDFEPVKDAIKEFKKLKYVTIKSTKRI